MASSARIDAGDAAAAPGKIAGEKAGAGADVEQPLAGQPDLQPVQTVEEFHGETLAELPVIGSRRPVVHKGFLESRHGSVLIRAY
jgi:hypothetical protein